MGDGSFYGGTFELKVLGKSGEELWGNGLSKYSINIGDLWR